MSRPGTEARIASVNRLNTGERDAASLQVRTQAYLALEEFDLARATLAQWSELEPQNVLPRLLLSRSHIAEEENFEAAEAALLAVLELDPENAEAGHNLEAVRKYREEVAKTVDDNEEKV